MPPAQLTDVPQEEVGEVVESFVVDDGATHVVVDRQPNGKFVVTAY